MMMWPGKSLDLRYRQSIDVCPYSYDTYEGLLALHSVPAYRTDLFCCFCCYCLVQSYAPHVPTCSKSSTKHDDYAGKNLTVYELTDRCACCYVLTNVCQWHLICKYKYFISVVSFAAVLPVAYTLTVACRAHRMTRLVALLVCAAPSVFASTAAGSLRGVAQVMFAADRIFGALFGCFLLS